MHWAWRCLARGVNRHSVGRIAHRAKAPGIDQGPNAGVKRTRALAVDIERTAEHLQHFRRQMHPGINERSVQAHQAAAWFPG